MTRELRLKFCLLCVNRQYTNDNGYVCKLTNKQADFTDDCKHFRLDENEFRRLSIEKIDKYGLGDNKGFWKEFFKESNIDYDLTRKFSFFSRTIEQRDIGVETYIPKSKVNYGLLTLLPLVFFVLTFFQKQSIKDEPILIGILVVSLAAIGWIIFDYFNNKNDFVVNAIGFKINGQFIPWKIVLGTIIKIEHFQKFTNKYLVLITATNEDIEIKLNGLKGTTETIGNIVELYKERFRATNKPAD